MIDRVVLGLHVASRERGRQLAQRHGLARTGALVELRLALPDRAVSAPGFAAVARYVPEPERRVELTIQIDQGTVDVAPDGSITAAERGRAFLAELFVIHAEITAETWTGQAAALPALAGTAARLLDAATATGGPAFATQSPPHEPPGAPPALLLFNRLAALRYHRADAHAAAWNAAGHSAQSIVALGDPRAGGAIEVETNRQAAPPFGALDPHQRLTFLAGLATLAG